MHNRWWDKLSSHIGGIYPFVDELDSNFSSLGIGNIIQRKRLRGERVVLDSVGLLEKANLPYLLGNRTLVQGISRAPWMSYRNEAGVWKPTRVPAHGNERPDASAFTNELTARLLDEARCYIANNKVVGILLSGGMDSRVMAAVVRAVQMEAGHNFAVVGLTWGKEGSRDVVYARRVVERFGWDWQHFAITADTLHANIEQSALMGAEVSPLHLHAMPQVSAHANVDVILAGSYGDSIGRAEFSGRHITELQPILPRNHDRFGIIRRTALHQLRGRVIADASVTPHIPDDTKQLRRREIEQQKNYMRRMLQSCMHSIAAEIPIYQMFTSTMVVEHMWRLAPALRTNDWYTRLLNRLPGELLNIPWARTGKRYDDDSGVPDDYHVRYHCYSKWLRNELRDSITKSVTSDRIMSLGIINEKGLRATLNAWCSSNDQGVNRLDELVSWLASLDYFIRHYQLCDEDSGFDTKKVDLIRGSMGGFKAKLYVAARAVMRD